MFEVTDEDIELLIDNHRNKKTAKTPVYRLKDLVKHGLMYFYGDSHYREGKISPCRKSFSMYSTHTCHGTEAPSTPVIIPTGPGPVEAKEVRRLNKTGDCMLSCWAGYNIALLTSSFELHAYFKSELLFQEQFSDCSALAATADKIYIGLYSGGVVYFDPVSQSKVTKHCHAGTVTNLHMENKYLLSCSLDGTIFYKRRIRISGTGILDARYVSDSRFICACDNNGIAVFDNEATRTYEGHRARIKSLTYDRVGLSSSLDGSFGLFRWDNGGAFETTDVGCSMHKRLGEYRAVGYGMEQIKAIDLSRMEAVTSINTSSLSVDVKHNVVAYAAGTTVNFRDLRASDNLQVNIHKNIGDLSYSGNGDLLFVVTADSPYIIDIRYL